MSEELVSQSGRDELIPSFLEKPEEITEFIDTKEYDVVIVGAGTPGLPYALSAKEEGLSVAVLQKGPTASACGNICAAIDYESSNQSDVDNLVSRLVVSSGHRVKREVIDLWARESGKAFDWLKPLAEEAGCQIKTLGNGPHQALKDEHDYDINFKTLFFGPKPYSVGAGMVQLAKLAEKKGVDFYYKTPGVQLIQDESGKVVSVVGKSKEGAIKFSAKLGVVITTGDYQNDPEMIKYYCPDMQYFETKKSGRTGDGHKMVVWAGGQIENIGHTKMCHDFDSGPAGLMNMPLMRVKKNGKRFANEELVHMEYMNNYLFSKEDAGNYFEIFDSAYEEKFKDSPVRLQA